MNRHIYAALMDCVSIREARRLDLMMKNSTFHTMHHLTKHKTLIQF